MAEEINEPGRLWYATWFWRSLTLLGLGLALVALGEVQVISAGGRASAPVMPDYALLLPNLAVLLGLVVAFVGAATALITASAALLNAVRRRRAGSKPQDAIRARGDRHTR